jgi:hypothetical protein
MLDLDGGETLNWRLYISFNSCRYVAPGNCNVKSTNAIEKAMADTSPCGPLLPESNIP